jgi:hypothetical protein
MWYETLPAGRSWAALWSGYVLCGQCSAIRRTEGNCEVCGVSLPRSEFIAIRSDDGREVTVPSVVLAGAEGRYDDWIYLQMLEREWRRPTLEDDPPPASSHPPAVSSRAAIVVLFWSYFESRIERLLRSGLAAVPPPIAEDLLRRYSSIGSRLERLYRLTFEATYADDLRELGFADLWLHLARVQERRNAFAHGDPRAIDDSLVLSVVERLRIEHEAWIAVFNKRVAHRRRAAS